MTQYEKIVAEIAMSHFQWDILRSLNTGSYSGFISDIVKEGISLLTIQSELRELERKGFIKVCNTPAGEAPILRKLGMDLFGGDEPPSMEELNYFVKQYRDLFPAGVKVGGYYVRADEKEVTKKMKEFLKNYPEVSRSTILETTRKYVERFSESNYKFMRNASYFLHKQGVGSTLASECENVNDDKEDDSITSTGMERV